MLAAYLAGDEDTLRAAMPPDGEIYAAPGLINSGTYRGYDGFRQWIEQWEEAWDEVDYDLQDPVDIGETFVVIPVRIVGRGAGSGLEVDSVFGWLWEVRGERWPASTSIRRWTRRWKRRSGCRGRVERPALRDRR